MVRLRFIFALLVVLTFVGCLQVRRSVDNYQACKGDPVCWAEMNNVKEDTYNITKVATSAMPSVSIQEGIALLISNIVAFGFGVMKGKKKG